MSSTQDLQWLLTRKSSSYIVKQKGLGRVFSREPHNLTSIHSYTHSGLVNDKSVGIQPNADGKGFVLSTKKQNVSPGQIKGSRNVKVIKSGGSRRAAGVVANVIGKSGYRSDLLKPAVARASAIHKSQRPSGRKQPPARKVRGTGARKVLVQPQN
ncbi:ribosomal protein L28e [Acaromyces ingoldii]|uniref:Ribosomal protein L28e n=1 Tax=Acaromyces ingoldii TaxID=215250 RepID=A0A316YG46_9BASI|nr:ribosomal protein L28e [Acaromyces ingoldii]PWN88132.1 ribosomal protein L28e [Acaromyces ingoldii]